MLKLYSCRSLLMQTNVSIAFCIFSFAAQQLGARSTLTILLIVIAPATYGSGMPWQWKRWGLSRWDSWRQPIQSSPSIPFNIHILDSVWKNRGRGATDLPVRLYPPRLGISCRCSLPVLFCIPAQEHSVGREGDEQQPVNMRWPYCHCQFSMHYARTCFSASHDRTGALHVCVCVCVCARVRAYACVRTHAFVNMRAHSLACLPVPVCSAANHIILVLATLLWL